MIGKMISSVSCGQGRRLVKPIVLTVLTDLVELVPLALAASLVVALFEATAGAAVGDWTLWGRCAAMGALLVATFFMERASLLASFADGFAVSAESRLRLSDHVRRLPLGFLDERGQAALTNSIMGDVALAEHGMTHVLPQVVSGAVVAVLGPALLAFVDWRLALAVLCGLPVALAITAAGRQARRRGDERLQAARVAQAAALQEVLYGMALVKSCAGGDEAIGRTLAACEGYRDACLANERAVGSLNSLACAALQIGLPVVLACGAWLVSTCQVAPAAYVLFLFVGTRLFDPLSNAIMSWADLESARNGGGRVLALLDEPPLRGAGAPPRAGEIAFSDVAFGYGSRLALAGVSARMEPGTCTAIVGPSGSGKSTMLRLAARFYDPAAGDVRIDGKPLASCDPERLFTCMSMVFQDTSLFYDTIGNNIRYGREDASLQEVKRVARAARCHDFIERLPQGYDTLVGEGGSTLSGGERQRIAIARALLKDAPLVFLDEATSALDPLNERAVQEALDELMRNRTVVMVAHQLKTVQGADQILVLNDGCIVQSGTHDELLCTGGLYAHLWGLQQRSDQWSIR